MYQLSMVTDSELLGDICVPTVDDNKTVSYCEISVYQLSMITRQ